MQLNKTKQKKIYKMEKIYKKIFRDLKILYQRKGNFNFCWEIKCN